MKNARTLLPAMLLACLLCSCAQHTNSTQLDASTQSNYASTYDPDCVITKGLMYMTAAEMFPGNPQAQALALAAGKGDIKEIDRLVAEGADVNAVGTYGVTVPCWLLFHPNKDGFRRLLEKGANPNKIWYCGTRRQESLMHAVTRRAGLIGTDYLRMAIEIGKGDPNLLPPDGKIRPIEMALRPRNTEAFIVLYNAGAKTDINDEFGRPLIDLAASHGNFEITLFLLQHGADYRSKCNTCNTSYINEATNRKLKYDVIARTPTIDQYMWLWRCVDFLEKRGMTFDCTPCNYCKPAVRPATLDTTPPLSGVHERPRVQ